MSLKCVGEQIGYGSDLDTGPYTLFDCIFLFTNIGKILEESPSQVDELVTVTGMINSFLEINSPKKVSPHL